MTSRPLTSLQMPVHALVQVFAPVLMLVGLSGCAGGGGDASTAGPATAYGLGLACGDGARDQAAGYAVENNVWNKQGASGYRQCVGIAPAAGGSGVDAAWTWSWPGASTTVRSYPELIFGRKPWSATTHPGLPRRLSQLSQVQVQVQLAYDSTHTGAGNLAFDVWLTASDTPVGDHLPLKHELMVWLDRFGGMTPAGRVVDTVDIAGITWDLYVTTADWGPEPFQYLAYLPRAALPSPVALDLQAFLAHLKSRSSIAGNERLASVEFGNEVISGTGSTHITGYTVHIQ